jgi:hypothetical protein
VNFSVSSELGFIPLDPSLPVFPVNEKVEFFQTGHGNLRMNIQIIVQAAGAAFLRADNNQIGFHF